MNPSRLLPLFLDLEGRDVLVVGAGAVGAKKIRDLIGACAKVHVVALSAHDDVKVMDCDGEIRLESRAFDERDVDGKWLVVSATGIPEVERRVYAAAEKQHVFTIAVDDLASGSAASGSVIRRPPFVVALSSSAELPAMTRLLREILERALPEESWISAARALRAKWKADKTPMGSRFEELVALVTTKDASKEA